MNLNVSHNGQCTISFSIVMSADLLNSTTFTSSDKIDVVPTFTAVCSFVVISILLHLSLFYSSLDLCWFHLFNYSRLPITTYQMGLNGDLLHGISDYNFDKPSAIQQRAIVPILKGRDVIAQAQSGTGKTATFSIAVLQSVVTMNRETQALILCPTRELAQQIQTVIVALGHHMSINCHAWFPLSNFSVSDVFLSFPCLILSFPF